MGVGGIGKIKKTLFERLFYLFHFKIFFYRPFFSKNHILRIIKAIMIRELTEQRVENNKIKKLKYNFWIYFLDGFIGNNCHRILFVIC